MTEAPKRGQAVRTLPTVAPYGHPDFNVQVRGMLIVDSGLVARKPSVSGVVMGYVAGHGGDVWWVAHDDGSGVAAYCFDELEAI